MALDTAWGINQVTIANIIFLCSPEAYMLEAENMLLPVEWSFIYLTIHVQWKGKAANWLTVSLIARRVP